ncbi:class I SAM-dependent methyltransferase [Pikeienuella piscinae]|uniref:Class I SAM-dependent methyltransferase n=1 Tax=Pikeienuella piscinae TaxID=2748098 RepID=A0A7L5BYQ4_9RHOB|nr:cyclopropane-fatty-acyl-phospholipid synthase family protein [Pikeienuella piscinae]QIE55968.1 class I SAM-dependent methyltransferase [Pikeienuella piscinae]
MTGSKDGPTPRYFRAVWNIVKALKIGSMAFVLPDGRRFESKGPAPGPHGEIVVRNPEMFARLVREGDLGFAEAYMDGWWDTPDLQGLMDVILLNNDSVGRGFPGMFLVRSYERVRHWMNRNTKAGSARNIAHHYDLGNEFYSAWLDETMTYSSALFRREGEPLAAAQANKYASILDQIGAGENSHVLEIGCGWGGFAEYAAKERGAKVTGITISREQHAFAAARMQREGLGEKVEIVMRDYRDEAGRYDGVASIEMFEAVGEQFWPGYFDTVRERLKPGSSASLQIITIADEWFPSYRKGVDFIQKYIFPGGMLPSPTELRKQVSRAGLELNGSIEFGQSYSETLRQWRTAFNDRWDEIRALGFDDRFHRMWNYYLASCAGTFMSGTTDVTQVAIRRPA